MFVNRCHMIRMHFVNHDVLLDVASLRWIIPSPFNRAIILSRDGDVGFLARILTCLIVRVTRAHVTANNTLGLVASLSSVRWSR